MASGEPSRIIRWMVIRLLKTTVHVESRNRNCSARKTSPTPASPACVATRMCSIYFVFGGAAYIRRCQKHYAYHSSSTQFLPGVFPMLRHTDLDLGRSLDRFLKRARHSCFATSYSPNARLLSMGRFGGLLFSLLRWQDYGRAAVPCCVDKNVSGARWARLQYM